MNLDAIDVPAAIARLIPREMAERLRALPIGRNGSTLMVAFADPYDNSAAEEIGSATPQRPSNIPSGEARCGPHGRFRELRLRVVSRCDVPAAVTA